MGGISVMNIATALQSLTPNAEWVIINSTLSWHSTDITQPTDDEIDAELTRLQAEYDNNQYQRDRQYAPTGDQLDMLWHSIDAGEFGDTAKQSEFYTANKAVKDANPKP
jgi:hypothetical protein